MKNTILALIATLVSSSSAFAVDEFERGYQEGAKSCLAESFYVCTVTAPMSKMHAKVAGEVGSITRSGTSRGNTIKAVYEFCEMSGLDTDACKKAITLGKTDCRKL